MVDVGIDSFQVEPCGSRDVMHLIYPEFSFVLVAADCSPPYGRAVSLPIWFTILL